MKILSLQAVFLLLIASAAFGADALSQHEDETLSVYLARLEKSGNEGNAIAFYKLGEIYEDGNVVKKDAKTALGWYEKSAEAGYHEGLTRVGYFYNLGIGTESNPQKAFRYYERGAKMGNYYAAYSMGLSYNEGRGVEKNIEQSNYWFEKAYEFGNLNQKVSVGEYYLLFRKDTPYEARGFKILEDAATNHDHTEAQRFLGTSYYLLDRTYNAERAFYWLQKAAAKGNTIAEFYLGKMYMRGDDPPAIDEKKGMALWEKAAAKDYPQALFAVGIYNVMGEGGLPQNPGKGLPYLLKADSLGDHDAQRMLGYLYLDGSILPKDTAKGVAFLEKAAAQGDAQALSTLADLYLSGKAVPQDWDKALQMAKAAAAKGNVRAQELVNAFTEIGEARKALGPDLTRAENEAAAHATMQKQALQEPTSTPVSPQ